MLEPKQNEWILRDEEVLSIALPGAHNRRNATLVVKAAEFLAIGTREEAVAALESFPGTDRRFEKLATNLYSDYGHHPEEIAATLQLASELSANIVLVYQPHQNRRQHEIKEAYTTQFEKARRIYWLPTYLSREDPTLPILTPEKLTEHVSNRAQITYADCNDALWEAIEAEREHGALVLCMGAGSIDQWVRQKLTV